MVGEGLAEHRGVEDRLTLGSGSGIGLANTNEGMHASIFAPTTRSTGFAPSPSRTKQPLPDRSLPWYLESVSGTNNVTMGDRGRLVVPADVRTRRGLSEGTPLVLLDTHEGIVLLTRKQLQARVRADLAGLDLVSDLLSERRTLAHGEDDAP